MCSARNNTTKPVPHRSVTHLTCSSLDGELSMLRSGSEMVFRLCSWNPISIMPILCVEQTVAAVLMTRMLAGRLLTGSASRAPLHPSAHHQRRQHCSAAADHAHCRPGSHHVSNPGLRLRAHSTAGRAFKQVTQHSVSVRWGCCLSCSRHEAFITCCQGLSESEDA